MKKYLLTLLLALSVLFLHSQTKQLGVIRGKVIDSTARQGLQGTTITILTKADSSAAGFSVADKAGLFEIRNIPFGPYILGISYTGYTEIIKNIELTTANPILDLDSVMMKRDTALLTAVVVSVPPIIIKKDTTEFRANAFKTKPNATVEDLLKKLPGVDVDKDGNLEAQGQSIPKIYVDGKEFFGNDPKLATKNLTAEMVESIQVYDDMSDQAKFTKIDDGSRQKTINIKLKKDRKKGLFGRATAGVGTEDLYEANISANMFSNERKLSVVTGANNVNKAGFTSSDIVSSMGGGFGNTGFSGGRRGGGGGGQSALGAGNNRIMNGAVNFIDEWGSKLKVAGSYFVSDNKNVNRGTSYRQNLYENDSASYVNRESYTSNKSTNHRFNLRMEYAFDSMNSILITPAANIQQSSSSSLDSAITRATGINPKETYYAVYRLSDRSSDRSGVNFSNNLLFRHRFRKPGRTFTIGWNTAVNNSDGEAYNTSPYYLFNPAGDTIRTLSQRQRNEQDTRNFNNTISASMTELIDSNKMIELNYAYTVNKSISDQDTWDDPSGKGLYDSVNKSQTNYFENKNIFHRLGTNFRVKKEKYVWQVGGAVQLSSLENMSHREIFGKDSLMTQRFVNFFPSASFDYNFGPRRNIRINYRGSTRAPSISQLQDVRDENDKLNLREGNPNLKQEFNNNLNLSFNTFNMDNFLFINLELAASTVSNKIVTSTYNLGQGVLLYKPENLNGAWNTSFNGTIGIPLKKVATGKRSPMNINMTSTVRYARDVSRLQSILTYTHTHTIGQTFRFDYNIQDKLDIGARANYNYNNATYSVAQTGTSNKYFNQSYSLNVNYIFFKNFMLNSDFDYMLNSGRSDGFNQNVPLWNASLAYTLFKKRNGEIRLSVTDILNQNKSIDRTIGANYVEDTYTQVLRRYFMLSFMYNLNRFGGKPQGGPAGPGGPGGGRWNGGGGGMRGGSRF